MAEAVYEISTCDGRDGHDEDTVNRDGKFGSMDELVETVPKGTKITH